MAYQHQAYTLHAREVALKRGRRQIIYFFSQRRPKSGVPVDLPDGYEVATNRRTGLPYLKKV